jgi:hypothetical protein
MSLHLGYSGIVCGFPEAKENVKIIKVPPLISITSTDATYINQTFQIVIIFSSLIIRACNSFMTAGGFFCSASLATCCGKLKKETLQELKIWRRETHNKVQIGEEEPEDFRCSQRIQR